MAGLTDFATNQLDGSLGQNDARLQQSRILQNFGTRAQPDLLHAYAAKGTYFGGSTGVAQDRLAQDTGYQVSDIERQLQLQLANSRRNGILAATGTVL